VACVETISKPWDGIVKEPIDQLRFANAEVVSGSLSLVIATSGMWWR